MARPALRREVVAVLRGSYRISECRACSALAFRQMRLRDPAAVRVRYGYRRLHVLLRREGWPVNRKRVHRLYAKEGLSIRT